MRRRVPRFTRCGAAVWDQPTLVMPVGFYCRRWHGHVGKHKRGMLTRFLEACEA